MGVNTQSVSPSTSETLVMAAALGVALAVAGFLLGWAAGLLRNWLSRRGLIRAPAVRPLSFAVGACIAGAIWGAGLGLIPLMRPFFRRLLGL
jgi:hypothetical protein